VGEANDCAPAENAGGMCQMSSRYPRRDLRRSKSELRLTGERSATETGTLRSGGGGWKPRSSWALAADPTTADRQIQLAWDTIQARHHEESSSVGYGVIWQLQYPELRRLVLASVGKSPVAYPTA
jgi:hypothetical protein